MHRPASGGRVIDNDVLVSDLDADPRHGGVDIERQVIEASAASIDGDVDGGRVTQRDGGGQVAYLVEERVGPVEPGVWGVEEGAVAVVGQRPVGWCRTANTGRVGRGRIQIRIRIRVIGSHIHQHRHILNRRRGIIVGDWRVGHRVHCDRHGRGVAQTQGVAYLIDEHVWPVDIGSGV